MLELEPAPVAKPAQEPQVYPLSIAAYRALGEMGMVPKSTELLYGRIYQKMSKSPSHSAYVRRLIKLINELSLPGRFVTSEQPISCLNSEPEPDVAVIQGKEDDYWNDHPHTADLVIEVCVSSEDRFKLRAYASAEVKEVWFVLVPGKQVEVHRLPVNGQFTEMKIYGPGGRVQSSAVPEFNLEMNSFFQKERA